MPALPGAGAYKLSCAPAFVVNAFIIASGKVGVIFKGQTKREHIQLMTSTRKTLTFLSTSALAAGAAHGAVLYTPFNTTMALNATLDFDLNQDGASDYLLKFDGGAAKPYIDNGPSFGTAFVLGEASLGLPLTPAGTMIDGSYESLQTRVYFNQDHDGNVVGGWTVAGDIEGYVGLEMIDGEGTHYGWAHFIYNQNGVSPYDSATGTLRLVDTAIETVADVGILTGQTAETGQPVVAVPPSSQTGYLGGTARLTAVAPGFPAPAFQWRAGAVGSGVYTNLPDGAGVSQGAINTLTLQNLTPANMADYVVVVSNSYGAVTSSIPATLTVVAATDSPATLVHRYSFKDSVGSSTFADSVGGPAWDGTVQGSATLTSSGLQLDGAPGCYATLPPNITSNYTAFTVEFWADIGASNQIWTRVFSFGDGTTGTKLSGVDFCPYAGGGFQNLDLSNTNGVDAYANNDVSLLGSNNVHVTVIVDPTKAVLCYFNGTSVVSSLNGVVSSLAGINDVDNWIGASLVAADPYLTGTIHELRIYQGVLPIQAIALNDAVGPDQYVQLSAHPTVKVSHSGGQIILSWPASDYGFTVESRTDFTSGSGWTPLPNAPVLVGANWQVILPETGTPQFFQLAHP